MGSREIVDRASAVVVQVAERQRCLPAVTTYGRDFFPDLPRGEGQSVDDKAPEEVLERGIEEDNGGAENIGLVHRRAPGDRARQTFIKLDETTNPGELAPGLLRETADDIRQWRIQSGPPSESQYFRISSGYFVVARPSFSTVMTSTSL